MARETINGISVPVPGTGEPADFQGDLRRFATDLPASIGATAAPRDDLPQNSTYGAAPFRTVTLIAGQDDEAASGSGGLYSVDTAYYDIGDRGHRITASSATSNLQLRVAYSPELAVPAAPSVIGARIYVSDASKITQLGFDIYSDAALTFADRWRRNTSHTGQTLVTGWNTVRIPTVASVRNHSWPDIHRIDVVGTATESGAWFTVGQVWFECPQKAGLLFIDDGPYDDFYTYGYPGLRERGFPCTFATSIVPIGTSIVQSGITMTRMSLAQLHEAANDGNGNSISLHSWGETVTSGMTEAEIRAESMKAIKWMNAQGFKGQYFRAAWWQENAPNYAAALPYYLGMATHKSDSGLAVWPPVDRYNIPRYSIYQARTLAEIDAHFEGLRDTRALSLMFTHRVAPNPGIYDCSIAQWDHILAWIDTGVSEGWLEGVTFEQLFARSGGRFRPSIRGGQLVEYLNEDGDLTIQMLP